MIDNKEIIQAISTYAEAYARLEEIQSSIKAFPRGDQKTGSIGEYYCYLYLRNKYPDAKVEHCVIDNQGWDIRLTCNNISELIQVKTVSGFSFNRRLSPIKDGFDKLFLLSLDKRLFPNAFWIINRNDLNCKFPIMNKSMRFFNDMRDDAGKGVLKYSSNFVEDMISNLEEAIFKNIQ